MKLIRFFFIVAAMFVMIGKTWSQKDITKKGFDLSNSTIPVDQIIDGGPPRDGIPSIDDPGFVKPEKADFIDPSSRVLGVTYNGISKVYPVKILNWHEVVNDYFGRKPLTITYCPLCGSGMAFKANIRGEDREFGVSGLLYNNDVLLYDRESESLWSQIESKAISGPLKGTELEYVQTTHTTWKKWKTMHPHTRVLSDNTGYNRDYEQNPYSGYEQENTTIFPTPHEDDRYHSKSWTLGIEVNGKHKAYPFEELRKTSGKIKDTFQGKHFIIQYNQEEHYAVAKTEDGKNYPSVMMYWFAWHAFHPESEVYTAGE